MKCFAWKDEKVEEILWEHLLNVAECMITRWESKGIAKKFSNVLDLDENEILDALWFAGAMHDIGKCLSKYQDAEIITEFPGHYWVSAQIVAYGLEKLGVERINELLKYLEPKSSLEILALMIIVPILFHHYPYFREGLIFRRMDTEFEEIVLSNCCRESLTKVLRAFRTRTEFGRRLVEAFGEVSKAERIPRVFRAESLVDVRDPSELFSYSFSEIKALLEASIGVLNLCDGEVSRRRRRLVSI